MITVQRDCPAAAESIPLRGGRVDGQSVLKNCRTGENVAVLQGGAVVRVTRGIGSVEPMAMVEGDELRLIGSFRNESNVIGAIDRGITDEMAMDAAKGA